jgi:A/G-specific adenine glycosylase
MILRLTRLLLIWYRKNRRVYPWRRTSEPYRVWLSEILLQQTRIPVALEFYSKILARYPLLDDLVHAKEDEFLSLWSGIGYYGRARNMLRCAEAIASRHDGSFPSDLSSLLRLPGIGPYTAGAILNICFGELTPALDGNITRVLARIRNLQTPENTRRFRQPLTQTFLRLGRGSPAGDFFQSLMELGERICLPQPKCLECPVSSFCLAYRNNTTRRIPSTREKKRAETFHWYFLLLQRSNSFYYMQNRERPFLKGAWMYPDILSKRKLHWKEIQKKYRRLSGIDVPEVEQKETVRHSVTFRRIQAHVLKAKRFRILKVSGRWLTRPELKSYPTSSIVQKILNRLDRES